MNFITTDIENYKQINKNNLKEIVIIIKDITNKKIIFNFPIERFSNFEEKYKNYIEKIRGTKFIENQEEYIITAETDYHIYTSFYEIFY
jgi:hypothetical protein